MKLPRISVDPAICTGKPCLRELRFPVARVSGLLAAGETRERILADYPYLKAEDIDKALRYAALPWFRWDYRKVSGSERAEVAIRQAKGRRVTHAKPMGG